jgi:hypothetical protein
MVEATQMDWQEKSKHALKIASHFNLASIINQWRQLTDEG